MSGYITLKKGNRCFPVRIADILYMKGDGSYADIFMKNGAKHLHECGRLALWESQLQASGLFLRALRSYLINWQAVESFDRDYALMSDKALIPLSKEGYELLALRFAA